MNTRMAVLSMTPKYAGLGHTCCILISGPYPGKPAFTRIDKYCMAAHLIYLHDKSKVHDDLYGIIPFRWLSHKAWLE
jgi:hypothetical protein